MSSSKEEGEETRDPRLEFMCEWTLKSLRLKIEKWSRLLIFDDAKKHINKFIETGKLQVNTEVTVTLCNST